MRHCLQLADEKSQYLYCTWTKKSNGFISNDTRYLFFFLFLQQTNVIILLKFKVITKFKIITIPE